jgi:hypothetical protein
MKNRLVVGAADPLGGMIDRVLDNLKSRTAAALASGATLAGEGWSLSGRELTVREGRSERVLPFVQIDHIGMFGGKLCLWRQGQEEPAARINPHSINAPVLGLLLSQWVQGKESAAAPGDGAEAGGTSFGRVLFERRNRAAMRLSALMAVAAGLVGTIFCIMPEARLVGVFVLLLALLAAFGAWYFRGSVFRCHERGVCRKSGRREKRLAYADVTDFAYSATRMFYEGVYTGTQLSMTLKSPQRTIRYSSSVRNPDEDLDELRDHIARVVGGRMVGAVQEGRSAAFGKDMVLTPQGVQFRRSGFMGRKPPELLPYREIRGWDIKDGFFFLWNQTEPKPVARQQTSTANFFPGFFALIELWEAARE